MSNLILITLWRSCEFLRFSVQKRKTRRAKRIAFPNVLWHPPPSLGNSCNIAITLTLRRSPVRFRDILSGRPPGRPHRRHGNNQASLGYEADERQREIPNCCMGDCGLLCWGLLGPLFLSNSPGPDTFSRTDLDSRPVNHPIALFKFLSTQPLVGSCRECR
jgi:hypothetical protein